VELLTRLQPFRDFSAMKDYMNLMNRLFHASYSPEGREEALTTTVFAPPVTEMPSPKNRPLKAG
jgi:hypothetical protein